MRRHHIARIALAPVLLGQAFYVRNRVRALPEAHGPREGWSGEGPPLRLLILGDSSAAGVGAATQETALLGRTVARFARHFTVHYRLIAETGARTRDALTWLDGHKGQYDLAITALGVNDVTKATPLPRFLNGQRAIWDRLRTNHGVKHILVSGVAPIGLFPALPQPLRWAVGARAEDFRGALDQLAASFSDVSLVNFDDALITEEMASDGFHPGPAIYDKWAEALCSRTPQMAGLLDLATPAP